MQAGDRDRACCAGTRKAAGTGLRRVPGYLAAVVGRISEGYCCLAISRSCGPDGRRAWNSGRGDAVRRRRWLTGPDSIGCRHAEGIGSAVTQAGDLDRACRAGPRKAAGTGRRRVPGYLAAVVGWISEGYCCLAIACCRGPDGRRAWNSGRGDPVRRRRWLTGPDSIGCRHAEGIGSAVTQACDRDRACRAGPRKAAGTGRRRVPGYLAAVVGWSSEGYCCLAIAWCRGHFGRCAGNPWNSGRGDAVRRRRWLTGPGSIGCRHGEGIGGAVSQAAYSYRACRPGASEAARIGGCRVPVIGLPTLEAGGVGVKATIAWALPAVAAPIVGAPGIVSGVTLFEAEEGRLVPTLLVAVTVKV